MKTYLFPLLLFYSIQPAFVQPDQKSISRLDEQQTESAVLKMPGGKTYRTEMVVKDDYGEREAFNPSRCANETFAGETRVAAKTHPCSCGKYRRYKTLESLLDVLPRDSMVRKRVPRLTATSERGAGEICKVTLPKVWILAVSREEDNDYHLILGNRQEAAQATRFMTAEISGLPNDLPPDDKIYLQMEKLREDFKTQLVGKITCTQTYKFPVGIPVEIKGSLFFDVGHSAGAVGPKGLRPETVWEIHPVTGIKFLD